MNREGREREGGKEEGEREGGKEERIRMTERRKRERNIIDERGRGRKVTEERKME